MNQLVTSDTEELDSIGEELAHVARLALSQQSEDVRLYLARLVRRYRGTQPQLASRLEELLKQKAVRSNSVLRRMPSAQVEAALDAPPIDASSQLSLLKAFPVDLQLKPPLLAEPVQCALEQLIQEHENVGRLTAAGLRPSRSAIFVGKPGVGKTLSAHWLASRLKLPLYVLDLTAVMSSLLGQTGNNLRAAIDFAKRGKCVLLLDEIDAVAKRRGDEGDVGELKRLVTVMLQEVESWPPQGLLLAATNHPELIDPALWRRFDLVINFKLPPPEGVRLGIERFLGPDRTRFEKWIEVLAFLMRGDSYSDIERTVQTLRRRLLLDEIGLQELMESYISMAATQELDRSEKQKLAILLSERTRLSQHAISNLTGVSRETIRKHVKQREGA